jgi:hypothetical protein
MHPLFNLFELKQLERNKPNGAETAKVVTFIAITMACEAINLGCHVGGRLACPF